MASPLRKESFNCPSPGWQDNQEQKKSVQKVLFGNMLSSFRLKETKASKGDCNTVLCKKDKVTPNGFLPWMDKVLKSVSRSLFGSSKQRTSAKVSEGEKVFFEKDPINRRTCSKDKPKDACFVENHLKLFNSLQGNVVSRDLRGHSAKAKCVKSEDFPMGVFLFQPLENSHLAEGLPVGMKKAGCQKQSVLGFARLQGEPTIYSDFSHVEKLPRSIDMMSSGESQRGSPLRLHGMQLTSFLDLMPAQAAPDKEKLNSVQDFFLYAEAEGVFFETQMIFFEKNGREKRNMSFALSFKIITSCRLRKCICSKILCKSKPPTPPFAIIHALLLSIWFKLG